MKGSRRGFTLIEVALFLVITGALFVAVTVGVQNSIYQQRYNDSVQNFTEFLRGVYSGVLNVQSTEGGRSEKAIYGKMITFGEKYNLAGDEINNEGGGSPAFVYTLVGDINTSNSGNTLKALSEAKINVVNDEKKLAGITESYTPKWSSEIEQACSNEECKYEPFQGTILIVRHPESGTVYTYYSKNVIQVNEIVKYANNEMNAGISGAGNINPLGNIMDLGFTSGQIDFCVNPYAGERINLRADVRIVKGVNNASSVEVVANDDNECNRGQ